MITWRPSALWTVAIVSAGSLTAYMAWFAHVQQMDFQVYRMGGQHLLSRELYSSEITVLGRHLVFTYPPIAALLFWPFSHLSVHVGQAVWDAIDLAALVALIAFSCAAAQRRTVARSDWQIGLIALAPVGLILYPVLEDLVLGQINIILVLMIVIDLTIGMSWRGKTLPAGLLVGLAAAIKLTPLIFIPYLIATRQGRSARNAALTFLVATGAMFAVTPGSSWLYFTKDAFDIQRVGNISEAGNQSLHAAYARAHLSLASGFLDLVAVVVLCFGLLVAVVAYRRSSAMLGMLVCAATGLMISPISWTHHYVWLVPALIWLLLGSDRPALGGRWALAGALVFIVIRPGQPGGSGLLWYLRNDVYVIATLAFVGLVGATVFARRKRKTSGSAATDVTPTPTRRAMATWFGSKAPRQRELDPKEPARSP